MSGDGGPTLTGQDKAAGAAAATADTAVADTMASAPGQASAPGLAASAAGENYAIGAEVARGGMGQILSARDLRLGRTVAIKTLLAGAQPELAERFERESRITARLQHPAIVPVYEAGRLTDGQPYYAMKWVAGRTLEAAIRAATTLGERLALLPAVITVVDAIAYAHSLRIIHRDIKPHNVLTGDFGETVVIDWGLAKDLAEAAEPAGLPYRAAGLHTQVGNVMGTVSYMPPEQAAGDHVDERADVYALGALLYHVLAGVPPYRGKDSDEVLEKVLREPPRPLAEVAPEVPRDLAALCERAMARDPAARPRARMLAELLRQFATGQLVAGHAYSAWELARRWVRRHRAAVTVAAIALVAAAVGATFAVRRVVAARDRAVSARADAEVQRARAEANVTALLEEQGRRDLLAGDPGRALTPLAAAYRRGTPSPALRVLVAAALRPFEAARMELPAHALAAQVGEHGFITLADGARVAWDSAGKRGAETRAGWAREVALSGDGALAASQQDGVVRVWDSASGTQRAQVSGGGALALSADGGLLATGAPLAVWAGDQQRWSWPDGRAPELGPRLEGAVALAWSDDGKLLASADKSGNAALIEAADGRVVRRFPHGSDVLTSIAFAPGGRRLATGARDGTLRIWRTDTDAVIAELGGHTDAVVVLAFSPDGVTLASAGFDQTVRLWDAFTGAQLALLAGHRTPVRALSWSRDGHTLLSTARDGQVEVWSVDLPRTARHTEIVTAAALSPDGRWLAAASQDGRAIELWPTGPGDAIGLDLTGASLLAWGDGRLAGAAGTRVAVWTGGTFQDRTETDLDAPVTALAFAADQLLVATGDRIVRLGGTELARAPGTKFLAIDGPDLIAVSDDTVTRFELATGRRAQSWPLPALLSVNGGAGAAAGHGRVVLALADKSARVLDLATGAWHTLVGADQAFPLATAFSPDGELIATCSFDGAARIWDSSGERRLLTVPANGSGACSSIQLTPTQLVTGGFDGARVWPLAREGRSPDEVSALAARYTTATSQAR